MLKKKIIMTLAGGLIFAGSPLYADSRDVIDSLETVKESLKKSIQKTDEDISRTDSLIALENKRFELLKSRHVADVARRNEELAALETELQEITLKSQREIGKQQAIESKIKNTKSYMDFLLVKQVALCNDLEKLIKMSLPEKISTRLERVTVLKRDLEAKSATPQEGFARLRAIVAEEVRFGDEISLTSSPIVRLDGEVINARILRIGNQWMVYVDEDESKYGILQRTVSDSSVTYTWKESVSFKEREMIREAIDVKQAKRAPTIVNLPLSLSVNKSEVQK